MSVKAIPAEQAARYGEGMCVAFDEQNGYHDSYFRGLFAVPVEDGYRFEWAETGSTAYGGGYVAVVDATEEVKAAYRVKRAAVMEQVAADQAEVEAQQPYVGKRVVVVNPPTRGKNKVEKGTTGEVVWYGKDDYRSTEQFTRYRVGVMIEGKKMFFDDNRVRVEGYEDAEIIPNKDSMVGYVIARSWPAV